MEPELIAAIGSGAFALLLLILLLITRRGRRTARARAGTLQQELTSSREAASTAAAGERESVWALGETGRLLAIARGERDDARALAADLESRIDDLRSRLAAADTDLAAARRDADGARIETARLETLATQTADDGSSVADLRRELRSAEEALERERANVGRLERAIASGDQDTPDDTGYRDRLVASEARRRDLEDRLASLLAVRASEQRTAAERIAGLERLHTEIGDRERRIDELESDLKQASESRDEALEEAARLQVEIVRLKGEVARATSRIEVLEEHSAALAEARERILALEQGSAATGASDEVERLRKSLEAERARAERLARRATETQTDASYAMWDRVVRERVDTAVERETRRLTDHIDHLRTVVEEKEARLRALTAGQEGGKPPTDPPPITAIKGIGPVIARILADHGFKTVADVAAMTEAEIERLGEAMPVYPGRIIDDDWIGQARSFL